MRAKQNRWLHVMVGGCLAATALMGCAAPAKHSNPLEEELAQTRQQLSDLESKIDGKDKALEEARRRAQEAERQAQLARETARREQAVGVDGSAALLPPNAKSGECYARVLVPPVYDSVTEQVLRKDAREKIEVLPGQYEWVEEKVLVKEASERLEVIPATYEWGEERVQVAPARQELVVVPAVYENIQEQVLVTPERTYWKKGRGPVERVDNGTGEIMCLVTDPAVYKTVSKRVLKTPETTRQVEVPAKFDTVKKRVLSTPETTRKVTIPAEYKTVKVKKEIQPPSTRKTTVPAMYDTVTKTKMVEPSYMQWRPILCETNTTGDVVTNVQRALKAKGFDPGPIDGILGAQTRSAMSRFQEDRKLARGALTFETMQALGINLSSR